jgi:glycosyltransferase involved in cell wall biosynthesis
MPHLSAILVVHNEAGQLAACLAGLVGLADEIVVVDDESTDGTREVARRFTDRILSRKLDGFGAQRQFALDHAAGDWVLSIDADERITPALRAEIVRVLGNPGASDGYEIRREVFFLGRRLRHGGLGDEHVLRLFRRARARFSENAVHERVLVAGRPARLQGALEHHTHRSLRRYVEKVNLYTGLAAGERFDRGDRFHWRMHLRPGWEFASRLILRGGFLDGHAGLIYAGLTAYATWLRALKMWELGRTGTSLAGDNPGASQAPNNELEPAAPHPGEPDPGSPAERSPAQPTRGKRHHRR